MERFGPDVIAHIGEAIGVAPDDLPKRPERLPTFGKPIAALASPQSFDPAKLTFTEAIRAWAAQWIEYKRIDTEPTFGASKKLLLGLAQKVELIEEILRQLPIGVAAGLPILHDNKALYPCLARLRLEAKELAGQYSCMSSRKRVRNVGLHLAVKDLDDIYFQFTGRESGIIYNDYKDYTEKTGGPFLDFVRRSTAPIWGENKLTGIVRVARAKR